MDQATATNGGSATAQAKDAASKVAEEASTQASDLKDSAKDHAGAVVDEAREQARNVLSDARRELEQQADQQARRAGDGLRAASSQLRAMADGGQPGAVTDVTRQVAGTLDRVSTRISEGGFRAVSDDLRGFARRQPGVFLLGAGVAGFLVARAVRAAGSSAVRESVTGAITPTPASPIPTSVDATATADATTTSPVMPEVASIR
jgi:hypothetical protein